VSSASLVQRELWKPSGSNQCYVLPHRPLDCSIDPDPGVIELTERPSTDPTDDYSVDVVGAMQVPTLASGENELFYDWLNVLRAPGRPSDRANLHRVEFSYGFPTGLSIVGLDFEAKVLGVELRGE